MACWQRQAGDRIVCLHARRSAPSTIASTQISSAAFPGVPLAQGEVRNSQTFAVSESGLMSEDTCTGYVCGEDRVGERISIFNERRHELVRQMGMTPTVAFEGARVSD
jgi:hypothetical protein